LTAEDSEDAHHEFLPTPNRISFSIGNPGLTSRMPKLACPCGFVHNLTPIPDDGWLAIRDRDLDAYIRHNHAYSAGFDAPPGSPEREASDRGCRETIRMATALYECPQCGRIMWEKEAGAKFHVYLPEDEPTRVHALALGTAADFQAEQELVKAEAIRVHNEAARIIAQRMITNGIRCPHCLEFSKQMKFVERGPVQWSFFQCPFCSRTFRLEKLRQRPPEAD
jgi:hypothetical protein